MNLGELIQRFRSATNDKVKPYFWSDEEVTQWLNDAEAEAAIRGRLIHESDRENVCTIELEAGRATYPLHRSIYELTSIALVDRDAGTWDPIDLTSTEELDRIAPGWRLERGKPKFAIQLDKSIRFVPQPEQDGEVHIEGYRRPIREMEDPDDTPEINTAHHRHLVCWALHIGFSIPDAELFDPRRAELAKEEFETYFGQQVDSDMRRTVRHDEPHHVKPFWV